MMNAGARMQQARSAQNRASKQKGSSSTSTGHHYGYGTSYGGGGRHEYDSSPASPRSGGTAHNNHSSEARQLPKVTYTSPSKYEFPWNDKKHIWEVAGNYDKQHSQGVVKEEMLNAMFRELYSKRAIFSTRFDLLKSLAIFTMGLSLIFALGYLISGLATTFYRFEIKSNSDKRYIDFEFSTSRPAEVIVVGIFAALFGVAISVFFYKEHESREQNRLKRRSFVISKIIERHGDKTFKGTRCYLSYAAGLDQQPILITISDSLRTKVVTQPTNTAVPAPLATQNAELQPVAEVQENNLGVEYPEIPPEQH